MSYIIAVGARWTKSVKLTFSIAVHTSGLAKNHFWLVVMQKERIGEQLIKAIFETCVLNLFRGFFFESEIQFR